MEEQKQSVCAKCGGTGIIGNGPTSYNPQPCTCQGLEQKHTPGPWKVSKKFPTHVYKWKDKNTFRIIATCDCHGKTDEDEANAELIARAPELLEQLKQLKETYQKMFQDIIAKDIELKQLKEENENLKWSVNHWEVIGKERTAKIENITKVKDELYYECKSLTEQVEKLRAELEERRQGNRDLLDLIELHKKENDRLREREKELIQSARLAILHLMNVADEDEFQSIEACKEGNNFLLKYK